MIKDDRNELRMGMDEVTVNQRKANSQVTVDEQRARRGSARESEAK